MQSLASLTRGGRNTCLSSSSSPLSPFLQWMCRCTVYASLITLLRKASDLYSLIHSLTSCLCVSFLLSHCFSLSLLTSFIHSVSHTRCPLFLAVHFNALYTLVHSTSTQHSAFFLYFVYSKCSSSSSSPLSLRYIDVKCANLSPFSQLERSLSPV